LIFDFAGQAPEQIGKLHITESGMERTTFLKLQQCVQTINVYNIILKNTFF